MHMKFSQLIAITFPIIVLAGCQNLSRSPVNVRAFGAAGDGITKDTAAFQKALDTCGTRGGGEVVVPAGNYLIGSIELKSHTVLRFETNAVLVGSSNLDDYPIISGRWEGRWVNAHRALVSANKAEHIAIIGPGKLAGSDVLGGRQMPRRPCVIEPIDCRDVRLEGFTASQRLMWTIHPTYCENVVARNLTIRSVGGNSDGIDVDSCKHVLIESCDISSGDDCIALKSGRGMEGYRAARPTEDVTIRNCTFADNIFACIGIGSETSGGIRGVTIEHCRFTQAKTYAIYIKSRPGRGAFIEDISARDLEVNTAPGGFLRINLLNSGIQDPEPVLGDEGIPRAKNFHFTDVQVNCGTLVNASSISPLKPLEGLSLVNVTGNCTNAVSLANIIHAELRNVQVTGYTGEVLTQTNVQDLQISPK
jgi:polygalacturonase